MTGFFFWDWLKHDHNYGGGSTSTDHRDGYVEGTTGNDVIGAGYTDSDGDKIDSNDAILTGETGNDDIVIAGKGDDKVYSGKGNDEVYGGGGKDTVLGGSGDDVIYGDATRSAPGTVSNSYDCKSLWDYSSNCDKWFDWGNLVCKKLSWFDSWDNHLKLTLDKGCLLSKLNFDGASKGGYAKIFDINGKVLFEGNVSSTLSLNIDAAVKIELWTNNGCTLKSIDYAQGGFDGIDGGEADDDLLEGGLGNDTIYGNAGDDTIKGQEGNDKLYGNSGDDRIEGGKGADLIFGDGSGGGSNAGEVDLDVSGAKYTLATWSLNSFTVTGADGNVFPNSTSGLSDSKVAGATLTIKAGTQPVAVGVNDSDSRLEDGDLNQVLAKGVTINGVSAGAGSRFTPEYAYSIRPVGSSDPNDVIKIYAVELHGNQTVGFVSDKPITVGQQYTMIEKISDYPNVQYSSLADSYITADGGAAGGASGANGNDTILGGSGDDTIYGGGGNDSIEGGSGKDVIYGDNGPNGGGSTPPASGARESFEWDKAPDPNSSGAIDNNDPLSGGFSQNTGSVNVSFSVKSTNESPETKFQTDQQKVHSITTDGPEADKYSSMASRLNSNDESATYQWAFSSTVSNVSFRINDIDADSKITVKAYDLNGNLVSIDVKAENGTHLTLSDKDGVGGKETVSHSGNDTAADTSPYHSVLVNIAGPISRLEIKHEQDGHDTSEINVTDIYFDATGGGNGGGNGVAGNDTILGGSGDDSLFGEGGDDSIIGGAGKDAMSGGEGNDVFKVSSSAEGAGDVIVGGNGPDQNTDNDTLDLRGAGKVTINQSADSTDAGSYKGTVIFSDGKTLTFSQIETILTDPQVNEKPDAIDDAATTAEDNSVTIDVLANDTDPEGDPLTIVNVSDPAHGTAAIVGGKIVYTPDADYNGTDTITYTISDGNGNTDTATVTVTVTPVNDAPVAADDAASTPEDTAVTINVLGNDTDVDGDPLTITNVSAPANGTATIVGGQIVYTPNPDFNGTDTITYTISDGKGGTDTATVTVTVGGVNDAPVAVDDTATTPEDTAITLNPLANDTDPDGDTLSIVGTPVSANGGTVTVNPNGTINYTPAPNFNGTDTITYTVTDPSGATDTATITVNVTPVNDAPVAGDDAVSTPEDTAVTIDVLANDTDVDGDTLSVAGLTPPANGTVQVVAGKIVYTPNANFNGTDSFTYTVSDGNGGTDVATVTVNVGGVNDAPVAVDDTVTTPEDQPVTFDPLANDTDPDGDPLSYQGTPTAEHGTVTVNPDGTITYTPDPDYNGPDTITYVVKDPSGLTDTGTITVNVTPVNDAPDAVDDASGTDQGAPVTIDVLGNDTDVDGDTLTIQSVGTPANGTAQIVAGKIVYTPAAGFVGTDTFTYTISDGNGGTDTATVTVTVDNVNDAPVAVDDTVTTPEDQPVTFDPLANDTDPDGDPLSYQGTPTAEHGTVTVNPDGTITYTPDPDYNGPDTITYVVKDPSGLTDTGTITVNVTPVNDAPDAVDDASGTDQGAPVTIDVLGNDTDVDGDTLTIQSVGTPANGTAQIVAGKIVYTPAAGFVGTDTFTYTISDGNGGTDTATVTVTVDNVNDAPVAVDDTVTTPEDQPVTFDPLANDTDPDGDPLSYDGVPTATNGTVTVNPDGTITYTPNPDFNGTDTITYTVKDPSGLTDTGTITVTVTPVNDAPVAVDDADTTDENTAVTIDVLGNDTDVDGDTLTIQSVGTPANGTAAIVAGMIVYTPHAGFAGTDTFEYTITDGNGGTDTATITVTVKDTIQPDGIVEGTDGDDLIDDDYTGDPEGDMVDNDDALDPTSGDDDLIEAYSGDDTVIAGSGDDTVYGGDGDDSIHGNSGDDSIFGEDGNDTIFGDEGDDTIDAGKDGRPDKAAAIPGVDNDTNPNDDRDLVYGGLGNDSIMTGDDADTIYGGAGTDTIKAGIDDDEVYGGSGDDLIDDIQGSDLIYGGDGNDTILAGIDTFSDYEGDDPNLPNPLYPGALSDPDKTDGKDTIYGGKGNDSIMTGDDADSIYGGSGEDTIHAGIDDDYVEGGKGKDSIIGGHGSDTIYGNSGDDWINAGDSTLLWGQEPDATDPVPENGKDLVYGGEGNDTIFGQDDDDSLYGGTGNDSIDGGIDDDFISGGQGDDTLLGGQGDDTIEGNTGNDLMYGGSGDDSIEGGQDVDTIHGDAGDDTLRGNMGDDVLYGGSGDDSIDGGAGNDTITGGDGVDNIFGANDRDVILGSNVGDFVDGGSGGDDYDILDLTGSKPAGGYIKVKYDTNPENGTVEYYDDKSMLLGTSRFEEIEKVIPCFTPGTLIATPRGEVPVESLKEGDRVITRDNGIQEIRWLGMTNLMGREALQKEHLKPVLIQKGSLGYGLPERDMLVSPNHRVLVNNDKTALYFEEREVLVAAKHLTGLAGVNRVDTMKTTYVHFMFDQHEVVLSDGSWTESFQPGHQTLDGLGNAQRQEILELFPELASEKGREDYHAARRTLKKHEAQLLTK